MNQYPIDHTYIAGWLKYQLQRLQWQGITGIALLLASLLLTVGMLIPQVKSTNALTTEIEKLRREMPRHQGKWIDHSPQASLNTFYRFLPPENEANAILATVLSIAGDNGLAPDKGEYVLVRNSQAAYSRYQISLPVRGSYLEIRKFVSQVLNAVPSIALTDISFKRPSIDSGEVEARLRWTLFLSGPEQP